jgi:hypothetical protein
LALEFPILLEYADARDVGKAAKDWPQLNFIVYHAAFRFTGGAYKVSTSRFRRAQLHACRLQPVVMPRGMKR